MDLPVTIVHTNNKHSRALFKNESIVIRLAKKLSRAEQKRHIEILQKKMEVHTKKVRTKIIVRPVRLFSLGNQTIYIPLPNGTSVQVDILCTTKNRTKQRGPLMWQVHVLQTANTQHIEKILWKILCIELLPIAIQEVETINAQTYQQHIPNVVIKTAKSIWGSCSHKNTITLNAALFFIPEHIRHYVIVHELAHTLVKNHSKKFWQTVSMYAPDYKATQKELRMYTLRCA